MALQRGTIFIRRHPYHCDAHDFLSISIRVQTIKMDAFKFTERANILREAESLSDARCLVEVKRPHSRCRETDFFGPTGGRRSITPGAGKYTPELVPDDDVSLVSSLTSTRQSTKF